MRLMSSSCLYQNSLENNLSVKMNLALVMVIPKVGASGPGSLLFNVVKLEMVMPQSRCLLMDYLITALNSKMTIPLKHVLSSQLSLTCLQARQN